MVLSEEPQEVLAVAKPYVYQLAYCSLLKVAMSEQALEALVSKAQESNLALGITGMLMMDEGVVVQWIEGDKAQVRALWSKLQRDPRHYCIVELLHRNYQESRLYPDWSMHRASRQEMLQIVHQARDQGNYGVPNPWAPAIEKLCELIDTDPMPSQPVPL